MAQLDSKSTIKNLKKKGFKDAKDKSPDHIRLEFWYKGKLTRAKTKFSHNGQDINDFLIATISKQVCLTKSEFIDLAKCPLSLEKYTQILGEKNIL